MDCEKNGLGTQKVTSNSPWLSGKWLERNQYQGLSKKCFGSKMVRMMEKHSRQKKSMYKIPEFEDKSRGELPIVGDSQKAVCIGGWQECEPSPRGLVGHA